MTSLPMQPVVIDAFGVVRFRPNLCVAWLLDQAMAGRRCGMNEVALQGFPAEDMMQFAQLIGYSVSGYGSLPEVTAESCSLADAEAAKVLAGADS